MAETKPTFTGDLEQSSWVTWTPTLTNITIGNGTVTAKYTKVNKTIFYRIIITFGTTTTMGTSPQFTLPATPQTFGGSGSGSLPIGNAHFEDNTVNSWEGMVYINAATPTTTATFVLTNSGGTYIQGATITSTAPHTWGTGDEIRASGFYEVA